ncbi:hypothetical protein CDAR_292001 [Caerostris darwini]|uniref:Uncharacterized protein n=1 Tax=Caerostris darwini TaxID=1538125 RepID=A0AAV4WTE5_9ARAC|nr:hypothetical protein CDAR_292001 [Caerostris darwini]
MFFRRSYQTENHNQSFNQGGQTKRQLGKKKEVENLSNIVNLVVLRCGKIFGLSPTFFFLSHFSPLLVKSSKSILSGSVNVVQEDVPAATKGNVCSK